MNAEAKRVTELLDALGVDTETLAKVLAEKNGQSKDNGKAIKKTKPKWQEMATAENGQKLVSRKGIVYGQAVTPSDKLPDGRPDAEAIHDARVNQLDKAIPGISKVSEIYSIGKHISGKKGMKYTRANQFHLMSNKPFTWVGLPTNRQGKPIGIGKLSAQEVCDKLKECGYGYSKGNQLWATDSNGNPVRRTKYGRCQEVGKTYGPNGQDDE